MIQSVVSIIQFGMAELKRQELKWENHKTFLFSQLQFMLENQSHLDVVLTSTEGQSIMVHRFVLCAASSYFKDLLSQHPSAKTTTIILQDVSYEILKALVEFIYVGEVAVNDEAQVSLFLKTATSLQIMGLRNKSNPLDVSQMDEEKEFNQVHQREDPVEDADDSSITVDHGKNELVQAHDETNHHEIEDDEMRQEIGSEELYVSEHFSLEDVNSSSDNSSDEQAICSTAAGPSAGPKRKGILTRPSPKTRGRANKQRGKKQKLSPARRTAADPNRPYGCSKCGRNYKRKDHLTRHSAHECVGVVIPNQPFECSKCGRLYKRKDHLLRHSAHECVGVGPSFSCTKCDYRARRRHHLSRHLTRVHKIDHRSKK